MRLIILIMSLMLSPLGFAAEPYVEGRHYEIVPFPQKISGSKIEVREFFWYGCPHCYRFEPAVESWLKRKSAKVNFVRTPAVSPNWAVHAQAYYAFEVMGVVDKIHRSFFDAYHEQGNRLNTPELIADFAASHGIDRALFMKTYGSFAVRVRMNQSRQDMDAYALNSVPEVIVDGKYRTNPNLAGGQDAAFKVVDYLVKKAQRERRKKK